MDKNFILNLGFGALLAVGGVGFLYTLDDKTIEQFKKIKSIVCD